MTTEPITLWRVAWREGPNDMTRDFDTSDAAERHAKWLGTPTASRHPITAHCYAIKVWPNDEEEVA